MKKINKTAQSWLWISFLVCVLDQITKFWAMRTEPYVIVRFLNIHTVLNKGAAFSILNHAGGWQVYVLSALAVCVMVCVIVYLRTLPARFQWRTFGLTLIVGGALGNVVDRMRLGTVIDFIDVHVHVWHFPTFNLADTAITTGAVLLLCALRS